MGQGNITSQPLLPQPPLLPTIDLMSSPSRSMDFVKRTQWLFRSIDFNMQSIEKKVRKLNTPVTTFHSLLRIHILQYPPDHNLSF